MMHVGALLLATFVSLVAAQFDSSQCGLTKGCFTNPDNCNVAAGECVSAASYSATGNGFVRMELHRQMLGAGPQYVAVGFSEDARMGDDMVIACIADGQGSGGVYLTKNRQHAVSEHFDANVTRANLLNSTATSTNGVLYCSTLVSVAPKQGRGYPLDHLYHLLLAYGSAFQPEGQDRPLLDRHDVDSELPIATVNAINVTSSIMASLVRGEESPYIQRLIRAHGCLMIVAWWGMSAVAILLARYFKRTWPALTLHDKAIWFQAHRTLNIVAVILTIAGAVCIFVARGWIVGQATADWQTFVHPILGLVTLLLGWSQPCNALLRCGPTAERRPLFNWIHRFIGISAWICGSVTIYLATFFDRQGLSVLSSDWTPRIFMFIYWGVVTLAIISLELLACLPTADQTDTIAMSEINGDVVPDDLRRKMTGDGMVEVRTAIFSLFTIVCIVLVVVLCVYIAQYGA